MKKIILILVFIVTLISCTDNQRARNWGGKETVELPNNHILLGVTWKENQMWILTKDTITNINYFKEKSSWGLMEGTVTIK